MGARRGGSRALVACVRYRYAIDDQLTGITDDHGNVTTHRYDNVGRRVETTDPDARHHTYGYDHDGLQTLATDALGASTFTTYNANGQPTSRHRGTSSAGPVLAEWTYGTTTPTKGLPRSETTHDTTGNWVSSVNTYDQWARPTSWSLTAPSGAGTGLAGTYTWSANHDAYGSTTSITYPAIAALPAETVTQGYDANERPTTSTSSLGTYVSATIFRSDGLLGSRTYGLGANRPSRYYGYDTNTLRLSIVAGSIPGASLFQYDAYTYDRDGNVTSITDGATGGPNQRQCFNNDSQSRLYEAFTTSATGACGTAAGANLSVGPDPYRQTWTHDTLGNVTHEVTTTGSTTTTADTTYGAGSAGPHAPTTVVAGNQTTTSTYDPNGNLANQVTHVGVSTTRTEGLTWDAQQRLSGVEVTNGSGPSNTTSSVYLASGDRVMRTTPDGTKVLYFAGHELTRSPTGAISARRYYSAGGATVATRTATGLTWLLSDPQGSSQISIDNGSTTVHRQRYLPYGAPRGPANQLPTDHDFLGHTKDDTTGLIDVGARWYDPVGGHFLSPDPLLTPDQPQSLNGYAYSRNNPATWSDPSGLRVPDDDNPGRNDRGWSHMAGTRTVRSMDQMSTATLRRGFFNAMNHGDLDEALRLSRILARRRKAEEKSRSDALRDAMRQRNVEVRSVLVRLHGGTPDGNSSIDVGLNTGESAARLAATSSDWLKVASVTTNGATILTVANTGYANYEETRGQGSLERRAADTGVKTVLQVAPGYWAGGVALGFCTVASLGSCLIVTGSVAIFSYAAAELIGDGWDWLDPFHVHQG